jgi:hypothetical protein
MKTVGKKPEAYVESSVKVSFIVHCLLIAGAALKGQ